MADGKHTQGPVTISNSANGSFYIHAGPVAFLRTYEPSQKMKGLVGSNDPRRAAYLAAEAFNVAHETGMTPRQLADRVAQLEAQRAGVHRALTGSDGNEPGMTCIANLPPYVDGVVQQLQEAEAERDELLAALKISLSYVEKVAATRPTEMTRAQRKFQAVRDADAIRAAISEVEGKEP